MYLPDRGRVRVEPIPFEFDPREEGPYPSRCTSLAVAGTHGKPAPWMGDAALRKFTGLTSLELRGSHLDSGPGPDALRSLTALTSLSVSLPTFTLASLAGLCGCGRLT